jgi:hypothetical protein
VNLLREHDLPPKWDGRVIEWGAWAENGPIFICDRTKRKGGLYVPTCAACGSTRPKLQSVGLRHPAPEDTEPGEYLRTHRNGTPVYAQEPMPAYRELHAERCQDCGHDTVYDMRSNESWDLDDTDYGHEGSVAP